MDLSLIVPSYNSEKYISQCLESLIDQDIPNDNYEIIVVNDGSSDNSPAIISQFIASHSDINLRCITQENRGQSAARNVGIDNAKGRYICFVDADDFLMRHKLGIALTHAKDLDCEILTYNIHSDTDIHNISESKDLEKIQTGIEYIGNHNYNNSPCYYLISQQFLSRYNLHFIEGRLCEDGMFTMNAFLHASKITHIDLNIYIYISHPGSTITSKDASHLYKMVQDYQYAIDYISQLQHCFRNKISKKCAQRIDNRKRSYIFFLLVRIMKSKLLISTINNILTDLESKGNYPIQRLSKDEYPGMTYTLIGYAICNRPIYLTVCVLYKFLFR